MKSILNKVYFHPIFLIIVLIFILIGRLKFITCFMLLILFHELGHIICAIYFKWNIKKIIILPFGGLIKFNELINRPLKEEFLIAVSGIVFQFLFYILTRNIINYEYYVIINLFILIFNLMPIYPLDGSKILNVILNLILSFKTSMFITLIVSYLMILILFLYIFNINKLLVLIFVFLFIETSKIYINKEQVFNRFLLERYLNNFNFKKSKIINNIHEMKRDYKHLFLISKDYKTEKTILQKMFDNKGNL